MYCNGLVAAIKCQGRVLRERNGGTVYLPFNSEYSIMLKNLSGKKAAVNIAIDGEDVLGGHQLIINKNSTTEIERFIKSSLSRGNKFKFIEKTPEIEAYRGNRIEDGIVKISFSFEADYTPINIYIDRSDDIDNVYTDFNRSPIDWNIHGSSTDNYNVSCQNSSYRDVQKSWCDVKNFSEEGITVPGSVSNQKFTYGSIGELESTVHTIVFHLRSSSELITVKKKIQCQSCGTRGASNDKFCRQCGTALEII